MQAIAIPACHARILRGCRRVLAAVSASLASLVLCLVSVAAEEAITEAPRPTSAAESTGQNSVIGALELARFLDRLMLVESGGRDDARNPRSTAVGPFQFIESTFIELTQRHFPAETRALAPVEVLKLRMNRAFARRVAEAFTRENADRLAAASLQPSFANLRLAFLVGPDGAVRVLKADPRTPVIAILGRKVAQANPFLAGMSVVDLARWSARNIALSGLVASRPGATRAPATVEQAQSLNPALAVRCNQALASCRHWIALASVRLERGQVVGAKSRAPRPAGKGRVP